MLTILPKIKDQIPTNNIGNYQYLFEPLELYIEETDITQDKLKIDIKLLNISTEVVEKTYTEYAVYDLASEDGISSILNINLMDLIMQIHNMNLYKFSSLDDIITDGWKASVSEYKYAIKIYTSEEINFKIIPIIGARRFNQLTFPIGIPATNEFDYFGLNTISLGVGDFNDDFNEDFANNEFPITEIERKWQGISYIKTTFKDPTLTNCKPIMEVIDNPGNTPCGGYVIWKSRFGGWMYCGFDIQTESIRHSYSGSIDTGLYEATKMYEGNPYVAVNYTGVSESYSKTLKVLSLSQKELKALSGISSSPAIYYVEEGSNKLELMRLNSMSAPLSSLSDGGDFSISLSSISNSTQKTI